MKKLLILLFFSSGISFASSNTSLQKSKVLNNKNLKYLMKLIEQQEIKKVKEFMSDKKILQDEVLLYTIFSTLVDQRENAEQLKQEKGISKQADDATIFFNQCAMLLEQKIIDLSHVN